MNQMDPDLDAPVDCTTCGTHLTSQDPKNFHYSGTVLQRVQCLNCADNEVVERYVDTEVITSQLTLLAALQAYPKKTSDEALLRWCVALDRVTQAMARIKGGVKTFETLVWYDGLKKLVRTKSNIHFDKEGLELDTGCTGGRALIELTRGGARLTLITDESSTANVMGVQGIYAKEEEALQLIKDGVKLWTTEWSKS